MASLFKRNKKKIFIFLFIYYSDLVVDASKLCLAVCFPSFIFISYYSWTMRCSFWTRGKLSNTIVTENVWLISRSQSDMLVIIYIQHVLRLLVKCIISNTKETQWSSHTHKQDPYVHLHLPLFFAVGKLCFKICYTGMSCYLVHWFSQTSVRGSWCCPGALLSRSTGIIPHIFLHFT